MLFVAGQKITDEQHVPVEAANTKPYVTDNLPRVFDTWDEARAFADGRTDYLGNLPGPKETGTWVRFHDTGLNIVGETHTHIILAEVTAAVRSPNFTYEQFATDALPAGSAFRAAYLAENDALLRTFGIDPNGGGDLTLVGGESLLPKIGYGLTKLRPDLLANDVTPLKASGGYVGKPVQRYMKIGWGWAKDLVNKPGRTATENALVVQVNDQHGVLEPFFAGLVVDRFIGDALDQNASACQSLLALCQAYIPVMIEHARNDPGLSVPERQRLTAMPTATNDQIHEIFALWRNLHFGNTVVAAAARNVRYAGMGNNHRLWLRDENRLPAGSHNYAITLAQFGATLAANRWRRP